MYNKIEFRSGEYIAIMEDGSSKSVGPNLLGMIDYVYGVNHDEGWEIERMDFLKIYQDKLMEDWASGKLVEDISSGKIRFGKLK